MMGGMFYASHSSEAPSPTQPRTTRRTKITPDASVTALLNSYRIQPTAPEKQKSHRDHKTAADDFAAAVTDFPSTLKSLLLEFETGQNPNGIHNLKLFSAVLKRWSLLDAPAAMEWLGQKEISQPFPEIYYGPLQGAYADNPAGYLQAMDEKWTPANRKIGIDWCARYCGKHHPEKIQALLANLTPDEQSSFLYSSLANANTSNWQLWLETIDQFSGKHTENLHKTFARKLNELNEAETQALLHTLSDSPYLSTYQKAAHKVALDKIFSSKHITQLSKSDITTAFKELVAMRVQSGLSEKAATQEIATHFNTQLSYEQRLSNTSSIDHDFQNILLGKNDLQQVLTNNMEKFQGLPEDFTSIPVSRLFLNAMRFSPTETIAYAKENDLLPHAQAAFTNLVMNRELRPQATNQLLRDAIQSPLWKSLPNANDYLSTHSKNYAKADIESARRWADSLPTAQTQAAAWKGIRSYYQRYNHPAQAEEVTSILDALEAQP